jgi:hypothetical protein
VSTGNRSVFFIFFSFLIIPSILSSSPGDRASLILCVCGNDAVNALATVRHNVQSSCCRVPSGEEEHDLSYLTFSLPKFLFFLLFFGINLQISPEEKVWGEKGDGDGAR